MFSGSCLCWRTAHVHFVLVTSSPALRGSFFTHPSLRWVTARTFHPDGRSSGYSYRGISPPAKQRTNFSPPPSLPRAAVRNAAAVCNNTAELKGPRAGLMAPFFVAPLNAHERRNPFLPLFQRVFSTPGATHVSSSHRYILSRN